MESRNEDGTGSAGFTMKVVGKRRHDAPASIDDSRQLLKTAWAIRGTDKIAPAGVYRFKTFEEADAWTTRAMAKTYARHRSKTSWRSAKASTTPEPATSRNFLQALIEEEEML